VVNLLDQKLWNPNPDFFSYTLSKAALEAANTLLAQALAPALRVVGVAPGLTLTSHMLSDEKFEALHRLSPLGRSRPPPPTWRPREICAGEPLHHRHHAAGGWRPASDEVRPRFFADVKPGPC
jgi:NAD(P)-dependent dehydrogenase (short-subunit alcohol dehydrogenase family)